MTKNRLRMFEVLVEKKPNNLTEWASLLHKDYSMIRTDARVLEAMGIIKLEKLGKKASSSCGGSDINYKEIKPIALYKRIVFDFPMVERENVSVVSKKVSDSSATLRLK